MYQHMRLDALFVQGRRREDSYNRKGPPGKLISAEVDLRAGHVIRVEDQILDLGASILAPAGQPQVSRYRIPVHHRDATQAEIDWYAW